MMIKKIRVWWFMRRLRKGAEKLSKRFPEAEAFSGVAGDPTLNAHYPSGRVLTVDEPVQPMNKPQPEIQ